MSPSAAVTFIASMYAIQLHSCGMHEIKYGAAVTVCTDSRIFLDFIVHAGTCMSPAASPS